VCNGYIITVFLTIKTLIITKLLFLMFENLFYY